MNVIEETFNLEFVISDWPVHVYPLHTRAAITIL
jgi:hypothetical protein